MTAVRSVSQRSVDSSGDSSQSLLQHSYFIAAFAIILALIILRIVVLRWRNQRMSDFFRIHSSSQYTYGSQPPNDTNYRTMYHGLQLAPVPAAYQPDRRVRAADIDAQGRRLGPTGEGSDGKEILPAYDNFDRPPKYVEASLSHGGSPCPTEQSAVIPSAEVERGGTEHPNTTSGAPGANVDQLSVDTRPAEIPPVHHYLLHS